jgi:NAD(P)H-dependent flavin oxidoreductase YrpB (nitropropane dioxygenase family)
MNQLCSRLSIDVPILQSGMGGAAGDIFAAAREHGDVETMPLYAGDSARLIHDLPTAAAVVGQLVAEAEAALGRPLSERHPPVA